MDDGSSRWIICGRVVQANRKRSTKMLGAATITTTLSVFSTLLIRVVVQI
jgi:hypothetical protein